MSIPDAAIEAAAEAMFHFADVVRPRVDGMEWFRAEAKYAIEAALPAIREAIAQEVEAAYDRPDLDLLAARIVRGGTP